MIDIRKKNEEVLEEIGSIEEWCDSIYDSDFYGYFKDVHDLYKKVEKGTMEDDSDTIEMILTELPIRMVEVSAILSKYQLREECMKLRIKQIESDVMKESIAKTVTAKKDEASNATIEDKLLLSAYCSLIKRVEDEISFTRELIMSTKKILGYNAKIEQANPIAPTELSSYTVGDGMSYVKGA